MISLTGQCVGAGSGLLAGAIWCRVMIRRAIRRGGDGLVKAGREVGGLVGVLSTVLLHIGLTVVAGHMLSGEKGGGYFQSGVINICIGLLFGIPAGVATGWICGGLCRWAAEAAGPSGLSGPAAMRSQLLRTKSAV